MAADKNNQGQKVLNVPTLRFPEFSGEWEIFKLKDLCGELEYGMNAAAKPFDGINKYIRITDIDEKTLQYSYDSVVSPDAEIEEKFRVRENDILFARTGASTGKTYIYDDRDGVLFYAGFLIRANVKHANSRFTFYQTQIPRYKKWVGIMSARSGQPGINSQEFGSYSIYLPSKQEQEKVSSLLRLLDERIVTQNKIIDNLKSLIKGLADDLISKFLESELHPFSTLYQKAGEGGTPATSVAAYYQNGSIPFVKIDDLSEKYLLKNKDYITELGLQKSSAWLIPTRSVIYSNGATIGAISINEYPVCTKQGILGIVPCDNVDVEYLYLLMSSTFFSKKVSKIVTEGTMKTAYLKDINRIQCPLPPLEQQIEITKLASSMNVKLSIEIKIVERLKKQKLYILRSMFI